MEIMGKKVVSLMLVISTLMIVVLAQLAMAQDICGQPVTAFLPCLPSVKQPSPPAPSPQCCGVIKTADEKCLCGYATSPLLPQYGIDKDLFLALPVKCGLPPCPSA